MRYLLPFLRWANLLLILITLLAYLSPLINPSKVWHFTYLGLAYPIMLLANMAFALFWAMRRDRYMLFSAACIIAGSGYLTSFMGFHFGKNPEKKAGSFTVVTYNVGSLKSLRNDEKDRQEAIKAELEKFVKRYGQPEIFCVQEGNPDLVTNFLRKNLGYKHHFKHKGTVIFSIYPFLKQDIVPFEASGNSCIWADLDTPKGTVRVYSAHLQSNSLSHTANRIATQGDPRKKQTWRDVRFVMKQYKRAVSIRAEQAAAVKAHIAKSPHPVILCGDLNDPPVSYVYRLMSKGMKDSFREKGSGIGATFAGKLPALRIDYVLTDPSFNILDHRIPKLELSDHYPVVVHLE